MANSLTAFNAVYWAREMQEVFFKESTALVLANTELRDQLTDGVTIHKPYRSYLYAVDYTRGNDITTFNDLTATDESLTVNTVRVVPFYIDDLDKIQNKYDHAAKSAQDAQRVLNQELDQAILAEYSNAAQFVSAQDLGGSGTGSVAITTANIANLFTAAARKLDFRSVPQAGRVAVIGPRLLEVLRLYVGGRETGFGESVSANGQIGNRFGFDLVLSENIPFTAVLTFGNVPTDADTLTIGGVTWTFESTGTACNVAGEIDLGGNITATGDNVVLALNGTTAGTTATYCEVSAANRYLLRKHGISATNAAGTVTVTGYGDVEITKSCSNLTITSVTSNPVFLLRGAIDLVTQKSPSVEFRTAEKRLGRYVYAWMCYGKKTFLDMTNAIVYAKVDASSWV